MRAVETVPVALRLLVERDRNPVAILATDHTIMLANQAFEGVAGAHREDIEGTRWPGVFSLPERRSTDRQIFTAGLMGVVTRCQLPFAPRRGRRLRIDVEMRILASALLVTIKRSEPIPRPSDARTADIDYLVTTTAADFGRLVRVSVGGVEIEQLAGESCHEVLFGRMSPCSRCPARANTPVVYFDEETERYKSLTATQLDWCCDVRVRHVRADVVASLARARCEHVARSAGLSDEQRTVLDYMLLNRSAASIAKLLSLSVHSVKALQAEVLELLGAKSRNELLTIFLRDWHRP